jgi:hypothetical protein
MDPFQNESDSWPRKIAGYSAIFKTENRVLYNLIWSFGEC